MRSKKVRLLKYVIPLSAGLLFGLLSLVPAWRTLERAVYDFFLHLKPEPPLVEGLYLLNVDEAAIQHVGMWPWPRSYIADGLVSLKEVGASQAIFDIEYVNKSAAGIDQGYFRNDLKATFDLSFQDMAGGWADLVNAVADGALDIGTALGYAQDILDFMESERQRLYQSVGAMALDNDAELGKAMRLFGGAWTTLNLQEVEDPSLPAALEALAAERFSVPVTGRSRAIASYPDAVFPMMEVLDNSKGIGFTNVELDGDGKLRRIRLFAEVGGKVYPQLAMAPLLDRLGRPEITVRPGSISLKGATLPSGKKADIQIPLDQNGFMVINWLKGDYLESFPGRHLTFDALVTLRELERDISSRLSAIVGEAAWTVVPGGVPLRPVLDAWLEAEALRRTALDSGADDDIQAFLESKEDALAVLSAAASSAWEGELAALAADRPEDEGLAAAASSLAAAREGLAAAVAGMEDKRKELSALKGATCVIGWTGIGTTDLGTNPFVKDYVNVGTHAAVANTILSRSFIREAPSWVSALLCLVLSLAFLFGKRLKTALYQNILGISVTLISVALSLGVFLVFSLYVAPVAIAASLLVGSIGYSSVVFFLEEQEKGFLRKAFGTYLSGAVIDQIVADPGQLKLGGDRKWMTAIFTDIRGFSTISEKLDATQLVALLNRYLSTMSDIVLERQGTIDKYEGDAIIAFFGAPLNLPNHASAALGSAVLMKRAERLLNDAILAEGMSPSPLATRIGVNTGEMVVGNMGTLKKMDYTIMGAAVNLASRLEGVNKQYDSWILASDAAVSETGSEFLSRRMDRVRVVGVNTPVQLWEVLDFWADAGSGAREMVEAFHAALALFEARDWEAARKAFAEIARGWPEDGPTKKYLKRCEDYLGGKAPISTWDGVYNLTEK